MHISMLQPSKTTGRHTRGGPRQNDRYCMGFLGSRFCSVLLCYQPCTTSVRAGSVAGVEFECSVVEYPSFIANLPTLQEPHYVLYTADTDDATQQPWCPDCQQADPIVEEVIKQSGGTLLKVKVSLYTSCISHIVYALFIAKYACMLPINH